MSQISNSRNTRVYGNPEQCKVVITIAKKAHDAIYIHGLLNPKQEVGGIFVGNVTQDGNGKHHVDIVAAVEAESAPGTRTRMQFTGPVWLEMLAKVQNSYPGLRVVGWYHTHPNLGVFLSDDDILAHNVAFSNPWHVAAVCDPVKRQLGFFSWDGDKLKPLEGFYVKDTATAVRGDTEAPSALPNLPHSHTNRIAVVVAPLLAIILALIGVSAYLFWIQRSVPTNNQNKPDPAIAQAFNSGAVRCDYFQPNNNKRFTYFVHRDGRVQLYVEDLGTGQQSFQASLQNYLPAFSNIEHIASHEIDIGNGRKQGYLVIEGESPQNNTPIIVSAHIGAVDGELKVLNTFSVSPDKLNFNSEGKEPQMKVSMTDFSGENNLIWVIMPDDRCKRWIDTRDQKLSGTRSQTLTFYLISDKLRDGTNAGNLNITYGPENKPEDWNIKWTIPVSAEKVPLPVASGPEENIHVTGVSGNPNVPDQSFPAWISIINESDPALNDRPPTINVYVAVYSTNDKCYTVSPPQRLVTLQKDVAGKIQGKAPFILTRVPKSQCTDPPKLYITLNWTAQQQRIEPEPWEVK